MNEKKLSKIQILSGNGLKIIAVITMLIDHIGAVLIEPGILTVQEINAPESINWWQVDAVLRMIGRISFPIFCFLIVEGFLHTRDVKKYALRLLAFSFISEIPFDLALFGTWFYPGYQNVYFTLLLGLLALIGLSRVRESLWKQALVLTACCGAAALFHTDYGAVGVFVIVLLYLLRDDKWMQTILGGISVSQELPAVLAFIPIRMYNGSRGKWNLKYLFYVFYPAHLLILWAIRVLWIA